MIVSAGHWDERDSVRHSELSKTADPGEPNKRRCCKGTRGSTSTTKRAKRCVHMCLCFGGWCRAVSQLSPCSGVSCAAKKREAEAKSRTQPADSATSSGLYSTATRGSYASHAEAILSGPQGQAPLGLRQKVVSFLTRSMDVVFLVTTHELESTLFMCRRWWITFTA